MSVELIRKAKRILGIVAVTLGSIIMLALSAWFVAYFAERGLSIEALKRSFGPEIMYWAPVLFFCIPGYLLTFEDGFNVVMSIKSQTIDILSLHV